MDRRKVLKRAGVLGGAAMAAMTVSSALAEEDDTSRTLEGGWMGTTDAGPGFGTFGALYSFARGGGLVTSSSIDLAPRSLSTPGYGSWERVGDRRFAFTFDAFVFDQQGNPAGRVEAR